MGASEFVGTPLHKITRLLEGGAGRVPSLRLVVAVLEAMIEASRGGVGCLAPGGVGVGVSGTATGSERRNKFRPGETGPLPFRECRAGGGEQGLVACLQKIRCNL